MKSSKILNSCLFFITLLIMFGNLKAPMIVVQGAIQLWPVTIINESGMTLVVIDEIIDPYGSSYNPQQLPSVIPNNQFTFQWPSTFDKPNARRITIYGRRHAVMLTNRIIIGNTAGATHPCVPSGDFTIIRQSRLTICVEDKLTKNQCSGR